MTRHLAGFALAGILLGAPIASAQTPPAPNAARAQHRAVFAQRIRDGIRSGQLTRAEFRRLRGLMARARARAAAMRASDSRLSGMERRQLRRAWRGINLRLFRLRHNGR